MYSAIHPIFTVRRQWERIVALGDVQDEGSRESYCFFQIERVLSKERLRRIEHEVFSLLKAVFLAVDDFQDMGRACRELVPRLRSRRGDASELASTRGFLEWLLDDNYIFMGTVSYGVGPDGTPVRADETANGVFTDPALLPVVFPGVVEHVEAHLHPPASDDRILDLDFCANASAIYHLEPIEDLTVREWGEDGKLSGLTLLLGRFARGAFAQRADRIPILKEKEDRLLERCGAIPSSHAWRETRATFNHFPKTDLFYADAADLERIIERIVHVASDDEIVVEGRKGAGYEALYVAFSKLRYAYHIEAALRRAFAYAFGPVAFGTSVDCGPVTLLIFYFDANRLEHPVDVDEARRLTEPLVTDWEDRVAAALEKEFGEREGRRLFRRYVTPESRSGLYREVTAPEQVPNDLRQLEALESRLEAGVVAKTAEMASLQLCTVRALDLTDILKTLQNLGLSVTEELRIPLTLPEGRRCFLYRFDVEAPADRVAALRQGEAALRGGPACPRRGAGDRRSR